MGKGMRAGKKPSKPGMGSMGGGMQKQLQQMQQMQRQMEALQAEIEEKEVTTTAGGGAVTAVVNGKKEITRLPTTRIFGFLICFLFPGMRRRFLGIIIHSPLAFVTRFLRRLRQFGRI